MSIRSACPADTHAISRVRLACWRATYAGIIPDTFLEPHFSAQFVERRERSLADLRNQEYGFVAEEVLEGPSGQEGRESIVDYALGGPAIGATSALTGEFYEVYVLPTMQHRGLGRELALRIACELLARGYALMRLYVLAENWKARRFYER